MRTCELCKAETERVSVHVTAQLDDDKLTISGVDCGKSSEEFWGDDDYEYWYYFDEHNTALLFSKIEAPDIDPLIALQKKFSGLEGCRKLRKFCEAEGIAFQFDNWV